MEAEDRTCPKCLKTFRYPSLLRKHERRKTPCTPILDVVRHQLDEESPRPTPGGLWACDKCHRTFARRTTLQRHRTQTCDTGVARLDAMENKLNQILKMVERPAPTHQFVCGDINITINAFGKETTEHIGPEVVCAVLNEVICEDGAFTKQAIQALVRTASLVYGDPHHPENITCYAPTKESADAYVRSCAGWESRMARTVVQDMTDLATSLLFTHQPHHNCEPYSGVLCNLRDNHKSYTQCMREVLVRNCQILIRSGQVAAQGETT